MNDKNNDEIDGCGWGSGSGSEMSFLDEENGWGRGSGSGCGYSLGDGGEDDELQREQYAKKM